MVAIIVGCGVYLPDESIQRKSASCAKYVCMYRHTRPNEYGRAPSGGFQTTGDDFKTGDRGSGLEPLMMVIRATHVLN